MIVARKSYLIFNLLGLCFFSKEILKNWLYLNWLRPVHLVIGFKIHVLIQPTGPNVRPRPSPFAQCIRPVSNMMDLVGQAHLTSALKTRSSKVYGPRNRTKDTPMQMRVGLSYTDHVSCSWVLLILVSVFFFLAALYTDFRICLDP